MSTTLDTARIAGDGWEAEILLSPENRRIQVIGYRGDRLPGLAGELDARAREHGFDKVFMKARSDDREALEAAGMETEATIAGYFDGDDAVVMARFLSEARRNRPHEDEERAIMDAITTRPPDDSLKPLPAGYRVLRATEDDAPELATLYEQVFASYPYPIHDPAYLAGTMASHIAYRIVRDASGAVVAAASAETDREHRNAEMTDFATLPSQRGLGLAQHLLQALEADMDTAGIPNLYTVARARSAGMNRVFYNRGYGFTGTLVNNCHIAGRFEDMHVWCR